MEPALRMMNYSNQDSIRVGRSGEWGAYENERNDFTPKQRRRLKQKESRRRKLMREAS
jgi:hypothetical protein